MENQPILNPLETTPINSSSAPINQVPAPAYAKTNLLVPILSTLLVSAVVFGFGGYYFGTRNIVPQQYVNKNKPVLTNSTETTIIQPSSTPNIANPSPSDKEIGVFKKKLKNWYRI